MALPILAQNTIVVVDVARPVLDRPAETILLGEICCIAVTAVGLRATVSPMPSADALG